jgi:hypothetical protein
MWAARRSQKCEGPCANVAAGTLARKRFEDASTIRKLALAISYFITSLYILLIVWPSIYCWQHGCKGADLDGFMPAFFLGPWGAVATAFSLNNAIKQTRKKQSWSWVFWPLAIIFAVVLLATIAFFAWVIYETAVHRK